MIQMTDNQSLSSMIGFIFANQDCQIITMIFGLSQGQIQNLILRFQMLNSAAKSFHFNFELL